MTAMRPGNRRNRRTARPTSGRPAAATRTAAPPSLKSIVWLASYPKSGNTWVRVFLANYLLNAKEPVPINEVYRVGLGDSISGAYRAVAGGHYDPEDYLGHLRLRDRVLRRVVANGAAINLLKTHNARQRVMNADMIPAKYTRSAVYILRDPLDVAVSYARHYGITPSEAVLRFSHANNGVAADPRAVGQYLGNWSVHVRSWVDTRDFPVHAMRFEDMKSAPHDTFAAMLDFMGVPVEDERLDRAVRFSSFREMQRQESETPFRERPKNTERFFHSGESGQWKTALSPGDAEALRRDHGDVMARFGYL